MENIVELLDKQSSNMAKCDHQLRIATCALFHPNNSNEEMLKTQKNSN